MGAAAVLSFIGIGRKLGLSITMGTQRLNLLAKGPPWWARLPVYFGLNLIAGYLALSESPGASVLSDSGWIQFMLVMPFCAPLWAAFAIAAPMHSAVAVIVAMIIGYSLSVWLLYCHFAVKTLGSYLACCLGVISQLALAVIGLALFISNMRAWS